MAKRRMKPRRFPQKPCSFCQSGKNPDYKKVEELTHLITDRGKIISRGRTGLCAKHQRKLAREVKRARHLALLPFVVRVK
jgi:small subunit ribosomal protein S18